MTDLIELARQCGGYDETIHGPGHSMEGTPTGDLIMSRESLERFAESVATQHPSQSAGEPVAWLYTAKPGYDMNPILSHGRWLSSYAGRKFFDERALFTAAAEPDAARVEADRRDAVWLAELLRRARPYIKAAATSYYDGTDGTSIRQSAASLFEKIEAALAAERKEQT